MRETVLQSNGETPLFWSPRCQYFIYRWFSRYVIPAMLVDGKQKIAH